MNNKVNLSVDLRVLCVLMTVVIIAMLGVWKPWQADTSNSRKITVSGTGKVTAQPDSYQFNPTYQKATTAELNSTVNTVTAKLKELGVQEKQIQVQSSAYQSPGAEKLIAPAPEQDATYAYLTIKVSDKELAQKVQDYIATSGATGQLTSYPVFSEEKQKQLQNGARDKAIEDAKSRAGKTAEQVDAKLGKVIEIKDSQNQYGIPFLTSGSADSARSSTEISKVSIYAGEQDITFSVEVIYQIK